MEENHRNDCRPADDVEDANATRAFGGKITKGMSVELAKARERGLPIRYFTEECVEVTRK